MLKSCKEDPVISHYRRDLCIYGRSGEGDRSLSSEGRGFLAISAILFEPNFPLGGATIVIFLVDWHTSVRWYRCCMSGKL